ncbi:Translation machinery-associated protein 22 [Loxospora ochrophaea]|nr:Translation machinery-associated protein 22 [Loxospora ochrophaea]
MAEAASSEPVALTEPQARHVVYCGEAIAASLSTLSLDAQKRAQKDTQKKEARAAALEAKTLAAKSTSKVLIKRVERNKRKYVTAISGLEAHGFDLKKVAKDFGKRFATGASVTKAVAGGVGEEIVVQGDLSDEVWEVLVEGEGYCGRVPEENVECVEDRKKKG